MVLGYDAPTTSAVAHIVFERTDYLITDYLITDYSSTCIMKLQELTDYLEDYWIENHIHSSIHLHALERFIAVNGIIKAPVFDGNFSLGDVAAFQDNLFNGLTAHFGKPFIVFFSANRIGVADQMDIKFFQEVGNGIKPIIKILDLMFINIITASSEKNAFADLVLILLGAYINAQHQECHTQK